MYSFDIGIFNILSLKKGQLSISSQGGMEGFSCCVISHSGKKCSKFHTARQATRSGRKGMRLKGERYGIYSSKRRVFLQERRMRNTAGVLVVMACLLSLMAGSPGCARDPGDPETAANAYERGDYASVVRLLKPLAEQGDPISQYNLGVLHARGEGVPKDLAAAAMWWQRAAEHGNADAQFVLGAMSATGEGVPVDPKGAARWWRMAAQQGNLDAQIALGGMYASGKGVPQEFSEAARWWRMAAEQGDAKSQYNLGVMYSKGEGVPQDVSEAVKWWQKAAEQGEIDAQYFLGVLYDNGRNVARDLSEAAKWYRKAAEQGDAKSQYNLAVMYSKGEGVPKDYVLSHMWSDLAARRFSDSGDGRRNEAEASRIWVASRMTPGQIALARRLAAEWKPVAEKLRSAGFSEMWKKGAAREVEFRKGRSIVRP